MAKPTNAARRTNRALAALAFFIAVLAGVAAGVQETSEEVTEPTDTVDVVEPPANTNGQRPAEIGLSWFNHGFGTEQIDYDMTSLSCRNVSESITPDVCAVAQTTFGDFMLIGTEGFWDESEQDLEGRVWIPLDVSIFVMRDDLEGPRAISVLDGSTEKALTDLPVTVDVYSTRIDRNDVLVIHQYLADDSEDAFSYRDSVQVVAMSPTGAPTVVATYEGYQLRVASSGSSIELSSLRYRSSNSTPNPQWFSRISLFPQSGTALPYSWNEVVTSKDQHVPNGQAMTLESTYSFPTTGSFTSNLSSPIA